MNIYRCKACRYLFEHSGDAERCPDCGKPFIRIARASEQEEYHQYRIEFGYEKPAKVS